MMRRNVALFLLLAVLISNTSCMTSSHSGDESTNSIEQTSLEGVMTDEDTTGEIETKIDGKALYNQLRQDEKIYRIDPYLNPELGDLYLNVYKRGFFDYYLLYTNSAPWEEDNADLPHIRTVQTNPNVYVMWGLHELFTNYVEEDKLYLCSIYFAVAIDEFAATIPSRGQSTYGKTYWGDCYVERVISDAEFASLYEQYLPILQGNGIYAIDPDPYYPARIDCVLTEEQILNFTVPSEEYAVIITFQVEYK